MEKKHSSHQKHSRPAFHGILSSMMLVLLIEIILMMTVLYFSSITEQLNQNALAILQKQVENRQNYLQTMLVDNQELSALSDSINNTTLSLLHSVILILKHWIRLVKTAFPCSMRSAPIWFQPCAIVLSPVSFWRCAPTALIRFPMMTLFHVFIFGIWIRIPLPPAAIPI